MAHRKIFSMPPTSVKIRKNWSWNLYNCTRPPPTEILNIFFNLLSRNCNNGLLRINSFFFFRYINNIKIESKKEDTTRENTRLASSTQINFSSATVTELCRCGWSSHRRPKSRFVGDAYLESNLHWGGQLATSP